MNDLIKELNKLRPTKEQVKDKPAFYAFGYVDAINSAIELVKNLGICSVNDTGCTICFDVGHYTCTDDKNHRKVICKCKQTD